MKKSRKFNVELTYTQLMLISFLIDSYIINLLHIDEDVQKDNDCIELRKAKNAIIQAYTGIAKNE